MMNITLLVPYFTGSHAQWATGYAEHSHHNVEILSLTGRFWKWRMHGGAVSLARKYKEHYRKSDLILTTDMLDLTTFIALTRNQTSTLPMAVYFHENQLAYPWSPTDRDVTRNRDKHYGFINFVSALTSNANLFNSEYHMQTFMKETALLLKHFPDYNELESIEKIRAKSSVLPLGLELKKFDVYEPGTKTHHTTPLILWNHRWEYDKNPDDFFNALYILADKGLQFEVAILGENFEQRPQVFLDAKKKLGNRIVQLGYAETFANYAKWLWAADILPITSKQEFFGISFIEAIYCGCYPILPNRLTYPELIPAELHEEHLYDNFDDLVNKLEAAVKNIQTTKDINLKNIIQKYD